MFQAVAQTIHQQIAAYNPPGSEPELEPLGSPLNPLGSIQAAYVLTFDDSFSLSAETH